MTIFSIYLNKNCGKIKTIEVVVVAKVNFGFLNVLGYSLLLEKF